MINDGSTMSFNAHVTMLKTYVGVVAQHFTLVTKMLKLKGLSSNLIQEEKVIA